MLNAQLRFTKDFLSNINKRFTSSNVPIFQGKKLRVITLDVYSTLIRLRQSPGHTYADFANRINIKCNPDELNEAFRRNFKILSKQKSCYGFRKDGEVAWWIELVKNCFADIGIKSAEINELANKLFYYFGTVEPWIVVDNQVHDYLNELRSRNIRLGIISNMDRRYRDILEAFELLSYFEIILLSSEIGMEKPNRHIFEKAAKYFQINQMDEMLHIGDNEEKDYNGAIKAGARAALLKSNEVACIDKEYVFCSLKDLINRLE